MSKAFTKEDDSADEPVVPALADLPAGVKNYLTPAGAAQLGRDLDAARQAVSVGGAKKPALEQRLLALTRRFELAEVVDPGGQPQGEVRFGAIVTVEDSDGKSRELHIVGIDEADPAQGRISWRAPVAKALIGASVGDEVTVQTPHGPDVLTIVAIRY